jgi:hypothetical protein
MDAKSEDDADDLEVAQAEACTLVASASTTSRRAAPRASLHGKTLIDGHICLRSQQPTSTFTSLGDSFRTRLGKWLADELAANDITLPCPVQFGPNDQVSCSHAV